MNKNDFLEELRNCLEGEIPDSEINNNISYYRDYITDDTKLDQLGNPRLIAKSIIDSYNASKDSFYKGLSGRNTEGYEDASYNYYGDNYNKNVNADSQFDKSFPWYYKMIGTILFILFLLLIIIIGGVFIKIFFSIILPVLIIVFIFKIILGIFRH